MTKNRPSDEQPASEIILYQTEDGTTRLSVRLEGETVWLTQAAIAELFQTTPQNVTIHVKSIYEEGELEAEATCKDYLQVRSEGTRQVEYRSFLPIGPGGDDIGPTTQTGVLLRESA